MLSNNLYFWEILVLRASLDRSMWKRGITGWTRKDKPAASPFSMLLVSIDPSTGLQIPAPSEVCSTV